MKTDGDKDVLLILETSSIVHTLPVEVVSVIREAATQARSHLTILVPAAWDIRHPASVFRALQRMLSEIYTEAGRVLYQRDELLLPVDIIIEDLLLRCGGSSVDQGGYVKVLRASISGRTYEVDAETKNTEPLYGTIAMGGTFDHLHSGHKVLLTMAAWISARRIIVAITDEALLGKKANKHLLESLEERRSHAQAFMNLIAPNLQIDTPALQDVYGPTAWDPDVQACIVSSESIKGAQAIDAERARKGLSALKTFVIDVIAPDATTEDKAERETFKMGSTAIRAWLAQKQQPAESTK